MVYTVTLNPALDHEVLVDGFRPGGLNRTKRENLHFGGKGVNVSTVLHSLGVETTALGFVAGFTGKALEDGLRAAGIRTDFVHLEEGLTRVNVKIRSVGGGEETEINSQGPVIPAPALETLFRKLDRLRPGDVLVLAGSLPAGLPGDVYQRILARVEGRGVLTVVDAARDVLRGVLPYRPFLIKPNRAELGELFGKDPLPGGEIPSCAKRLQEQGARNVLVSMAGDGSLLLDETGAQHRLGVPEGAVRHNVGAGDSMVAGFLAGWLETGDYAAAHRMGAAAGSATAFSDGLACASAVRALLPAF
ncbi:1-phosphofructokinase [uncultured Oscillibacter sp.]|uniref:1-phosphofructokinase n=1 Tax=uncultured Oscillibacter sp. TaxID=876091 RepID=UPI0025D05424|nr:1-phosphofructokinase [uncultured Oscillibacter sp.]